MNLPGAVQECGTLCIVCSTMTINKRVLSPLSSLAFREVPNFLNLATHGW